jgi:cytochrome oxidase Cu insertion factor (SCO1/SenC/PrrC family)
MVQAQRLLGPAGSRVQLLGIDANPSATSVADVRAYSLAHGMMHSWRFLTGPLPQLERVWRAYNVAVAIERGQVDHTPALFVIDPAGRLAKVYLTQMSYASINQQAQLLAQEASSLLPGQPPVLSHISYAQIPAIGPTQAVSLSRAGGGRVTLGPGSPRLLLFFATWDSEVTDLPAQLRALDAYQSTAAAAHLPSLVAVDEASVEPSGAELPRLLAGLPLSYPVAVDRDGRVGDGYGVQDAPWLVLVSSSGHVLWYYDVSTSGWLTSAALDRQLRAALSNPASGGPTPAQSALTGSPPLLAALHLQAGQLLGSRSALTARLHALHGYPTVINAWASWCGPCRSEFGLFASASTRFGKRVAFLGADTDDSGGDARSFLAQHPVSYPSYQTSTSSLSSLAVIEGLPTTIFVNRAGKVIHVHTGQYAAQGTLDQDIQTYALGG